MAAHGAEKALPGPTDSVAAEALPLPAAASNKKEIEANTMCVLCMSRA
jgi:hypothetical protein